MKKLNKFVKRLVHDYIFGTTFMTIIAFAINFIYAAWQAVLAISFGSAWYAALAVYYFILFAVRGWTLLFEKFASKLSGYEKLRKTLKYYQRIGLMLLALNLVFAVMVWYMISTGTASKYSTIPAIASAAYATYKFVAAIVNAARAKNYDDYVIRGLRKLTLIDAIVSLFAMEAAMVETFGDGIQGSLYPLVVASGIAACGACVIITVYMAVNSSIKLKKLDIQESTEKSGNNKDE
ncbi:MAG: hypothetical protein LUD27_09120 [Clostridia bacterium]|nr:hypothetical protein [Clostridia bacterium]